MNLEEKLLKFLERSKFPQVKKYKSLDFHSIVNNELGRAIVENICKLPDKCILSASELEEYNSLSESEISNLEALALKENLYPTDSNDDYEDRQEEEFLQKHLDIIEEQNAFLEKEKELLKLQHISLIKEKENCRNTYACSQRKTNDYFLNRVPENQLKLVSTYKCSASIIKEIHSAFEVPRENVWFMSNHILESYIEDEKKIHDLVQHFLNDNFQMTSDFKDFHLKIPGYSSKEIRILLKGIRDSKFAEVEAKSHHEKFNAIETFYKTQYSTVSNNSLFDGLSPRKCLKVEKKENDHLKKTADTLMSYVSYQIDKLIEAQFNEVDSLVVKELMQMYEKYTAKVQFIFDLALDQRSRLEILNTYVQHCRREFEDIGSLISFVSTHLENEKRVLMTDKVHFEKYLSENNASQKESFEEAILEMLQGESERLDALLREEKAEEDSVLRIMSDRAEKTGRLLLRCPALEWSEARFLRAFNEKMAGLGSTQGLLERTQGEHDQTRKVLERQKNRRLARSLFVHAMTDPRKFNEVLDFVREASRCAGHDSASFS